MMLRAKKIIPGMLTLMFLLLPGAARSARVEARPETVDYGELEKVVLAELKESNTPGAAVAIISGDRVIFAKGFGVANVETGTPVTTEMLFRLGSTTKMFTGAALVLLDEAARIKLDAPIGRYAKELHPRLASLTAHQLLSHTAGVADFAPPFISHDDAALAKMVRAWRDDALFTEPGQVYSYSSPGYWLAGYVIEEAGGKPYADMMDELLFQPLAMKSTTLRPSVAMTYPLAMGHSAGGAEAPKIIRPAFNNVAMWPAGSIYSNVKDLSRFVIALLNEGRLDGKQVFSPSLSARLGARHAAMPGAADVNYGYGLLSYDQRGVRVVTHGGFSRGYGSMIQMVPAHRFAVIVQTNKSGETLGRTREKAMELLLPLKPPGTESAKSALPLTAAETAGFVGKYRNGPQTWEILAKEGKLLMRQGETEITLTKTGPDRLSFGPSLENDVVFVPDAAGRIVHIFTGLYSGRKASPGQ